MSDLGQMVNSNVLFVSSINQVCEISTHTKGSLYGLNEAMQAVLTMY